MLLLLSNLVSAGPALFAACLTACLPTVAGIFAYPICVGLCTAGLFGPTP